MNTRMNDTTIRDKYKKSELTTYAISSLLTIINFLVFQ